MIFIKIAKDFSPVPGPRRKIEGDNSGELFREEYLLPKLLIAISEKEKLIVDLDGAVGYAASFLDEAFAGLIKHNNFSKEDVLNNIEIISNEEPYLIEDIYGYLQD